MTQEEKAKAYDEALEKARKYHAAAKAVNSIAATRYEDIFPQLCEPEDERIRKRLLWLLADYIGRWDYPETKAACRAWLEKQKYAPDDLQKSFEAGQTSIIDNPEQYGLCKKTEWSEDDEKMLTSIITRGNSQIPPHNTALRKEQIEWLMNRFIFLTPQSKQEPSEEEIEEMVNERATKSGTTKSEMAFYRNGIKDAIKRFSLCTKSEQESGPASHFYNLGL